jgi:hypothetical protein
VVTGLGSFLNGRLQSQAKKAYTDLIDKIEKAGGKVRGLPSAGPDNFAAVAAWVGDSGAAATGFIGLLISTILLLHQAGSGAVLPYVALAADVVTVVFLVILLLSEPSKHPTRWAIRLSPFQAAIIACNILLAGAVLVFG